MATRDPLQREPSGTTSEQPQPKKTYKKPLFRFKRVFETSALSCGKIHGTQGSCMHNRKVS